MIIAPDVSYYQRKVDSSFNRQWLIFRCCDGGFFDPNASFNADWSRGAVSQKRIKGWTAYVVYRPGQNAAVMANLAKIAPLDRVMIDVESWSGQIKGDHSAEINQLATLIAAKTSQARTWIYYNHGDGAEVAPHHYDWLSVVIAGYQSTRPGLPGPGKLIGWQYTNGVENHTANPSSTPPFGACDHNELYVDGIDPSGGGTPEGDDMTPEEHQWLQDLHDRLGKDDTEYYADVVQISPAVGRIEAAIKSLAASGTGLTAAQITAAVEAGIHNLNITSTVITSLTEAPS